MSSSISSRGKKYQLKAEGRGLIPLFKGWCGAWHESNQVIKYWSVINSNIEKFQRLICFPFPCLSTVPYHLSWENLFLLYVNNKGADQPAHPHSLISAFVVPCFDSIISILAISKISRPWLVPVAEQAGLSLTWSQTGFLVTWLIFDLARILLWWRHYFPFIHWTQVPISLCILHVTFMRFWSKLCRNLQE